MLSSISDLVSAITLVFDHYIPGSATDCQQEMGSRVHWPQGPTIGPKKPSETSYMRSPRLVLRLRLLRRDRDFPISAQIEGRENSKFKSKFNTLKSDLKFLGLKETGNSPSSHR